MNRTALRRRQAMLATVCVVAFVVPVPAQYNSLRNDRGTTATFPAVLLPRKNALVKAKQIEEVAEVRVAIGSRVERGDLLLRFVDAQERLELKLAEAMLENKIADRARSRKLFEDGHISEEEMENDVTLVKLAEAEVELARLLIDELSIRAPFAGVIAERYVDPGTSVEVGAPLLRISELSHLKLEALLPEEMLPFVSHRKDVRVTVRNPDASFTVVLEPRPVVIDPASGTFLLQIELENEGERLTPGVSCEIAIERTAD